MSRRHQKLNSHPMRQVSGNVGAEAWWYEEVKGMCVVTDRGDQFNIPWSLVRRALARLDKDDVPCEKCSCGVNHNDMCKVHG